MMADRRFNGNRIKKAPLHEAYPQTHFMNWSMPSI